MSHELVGSEEHGYRFNYKNEPGWHSLGTSYGENESPTSEDAVGRATEGVRVVKTPIQFTIDDQIYTSDSQFNIVRMPIREDDRMREFGVVGSSWQLESYANCAKIFNKLTEQYPVETCGLIKHGSLCFLALRADDWDVSGDKLTSYLVIQLSMQPGESHRVLHTNVRVVCNNTLQLAIGGAALNIKIPHEADSTSQMALAADIVKAFHESKDQAKRVCEFLTQAEFTVDEALAVFARAFPAPAMPRKLRILHKAFPDVTDRVTYVKSLDDEELKNLKKAEERYEQMLVRSGNLRDMAMEKFQNFDTPSFSGTAWAAYNAATEVSDWREGRNQFESAFVGSRAQEKVRAFSATTDLVAEKNEAFAALITD